MPQVAHLFRAVKRRLPMEELQEVRVIADLGFEGCTHARRGGGRQVLLADRETLDALQLSPGIIRENITTEGLNINGLAAGERLRIGEVLLEATDPCTPCGLMEAVRPGLRKEIRGRRGMLCRVLEGGVIRRGEQIEKLA